LKYLFIFFFLSAFLFGEEKAISTYDEALAFQELKQLEETSKKSNMLTSSILDSKIGNPVKDYLKENNILLIPVEHTGGKNY
jgi:hypothetical protein